MFRKVNNGLAENAEGIQVMCGLERIIYIHSAKRLTLHDEWSDTKGGGLGHTIRIPRKLYWDKPHDTEEVPQVVVQRMQADIREGVTAFSSKPPDMTFYTLS